MPTHAGITFEVEDGEQVAMTLEGSLATKRDKIVGVLVITDRRVLFARASGWTTWVRGPFAFERPRADLVDVRTREGGFGMAGRWPAEIELQFAAKTELVSSLAATQDDFQKLHDLVEPARDLTDDPRPSRTIGVVTDRTCSACRPPCRCSSPNAIPTALVGWGRVFDGDDREQTVIDAGVSNAPVRRRDVVEIAFLRQVGDEGCVLVGLGRGMGERQCRGRQWGAIVRLADERWALVKLRHFHQEFPFTNPPAPRSYGFYVEHAVTIAASFERVWWDSCNDDDRAWFAVASEQRDEEMVRLDALLQSEDPEARAYAEARMRQLVLPTRRP